MIEKSQILYGMFPRVNKKKCSVDKVILGNGEAWFRYICDRALELRRNRAWSFAKPAIGIEAESVNCRAQRFPVNELEIFRTAVEF